jgi:hypothetical protein
MKEKMLEMREIRAAGVVLISDEKVLYFRNATQNGKLTIPTGKSKHGDKGDLLIAAIRSLEKKAQIIDYSYQPDLLKFVGEVTYIQGRSFYRADKICLSIYSYTDKMAFSKVKIYEKRYDEKEIISLEQLAKNRDHDFLNKFNSVNGFIIKEFMPQIRDTNLGSISIANSVECASTLISIQIQ